MHHITCKADLDQLLAQHQKVVVDFWASFCGPCKHVEPHYKELEHQYAPANIKFAKANIELEAVSNLADDYKVDSIPTFIAFNNKKPVAKFVGGNKDAVSQLVENLHRS